MFLRQSRILVFCLFLGLSLAVKLHFPIRPNAHIQELQSESKELAAAHSYASTRCFQIYTPILANVAEEYEINFGACLSSYDNATALVNGKYSGDRQDILRSASISCSYPNSNCQVWTSEAQDLGTVVSRLECASSNAAESSKTFYTISANATEIAVKIQEEYRTLDSQLEICTKNADRTYVETTSDTYEKLNDCLKYGPSKTTPADRLF
ncbi:uncharacterized protein LOC108115902 [Drosophila eugracilis]|uniref:uncharacterized protein LOC108115902 n=1 Tax=Drosophila eugracilis TaxID=29029 RepID=UPI001BDAF47A|nr:uncharacterized protein LOC108115902 [Drosophila eugracilis]